MTERNNLMEEMCSKYYVSTQDRNFYEALEQIQEAMENGCPFCEFMTYWTDLPDDWVITFETLNALKKQGFKVVKRYCDKGKLDESFSYLVAWDKFDPWPYDEEY